MTDVIASEWLKIRSVRSTYYVLAAAASAVLLGALLAVGQVAEWNSASPESRAGFRDGDIGIVVLPLAQFCLAALGALAITAEYGTGMIRTSLVAVPRRASLLAGQAPIVAAVTLACGQAVAFATFAVGRMIIGDRHNAPVPSVPDAIPALLGSGLVMMVCGLVGLGLGAVIRSTAGTFIALSALLFVLPMSAQFLPPPWDDRVSTVMLPNLGSPPAALAGLAAYGVIALAAGTLALTRRDA
jgi:ABC-2 type transport system permease protein